VTLPDGSGGPFVFVDETTALNVPWCAGGSDQADARRLVTGEGSKRKNHRRPRRIHCRGVPLVLGTFDLYIAVLAQVLLLATIVAGVLAIVGASRARRHQH